LRLPDLERLKAEGLMHKEQGEDELDSALGLANGGGAINLFPGHAELDEEI
jgi:hypothetical protein